VDWYFNGNHLTNGSVLTISNFTRAYAGQYLVSATNAIGSTSVVVRIEVYAAATSRVVDAGDDGVELFANDSLQACPGAPPTYQWSENGLPLTGETNRSLILRNVRASQAGVYSVSVTNCFGVTTYTNTTVAVTVDVRFIAQIANGQVTLSWRATPGKHYQVQYRANLGLPVWTTLPSGQSLTTLTTTLSVTDPLNNGPRFYRVVLLD